MYNVIKFSGERERERQVGLTSVSGVHVNKWIKAKGATGHFMDNVGKEATK